MDKEAIKGKRRARKLLVQALYQWDLSQADPYEVEVQFHTANNMERIDKEYFAAVLHGVPKKIVEIEDTFSPFLDRTIDSLNPVELSILRLSTYELLFSLEVPYRVVLEEAVALAKEFGSQDGFKYVNGILHQVAQKSRLAEITP